VTSFPDDTHAARGYSLGAVDYILAPVDPEVLKTKVMVFVDLYRKTAQVKLQADILARRAAQLHRLTQASLAINSALSLEQMIQVVADLARDILNVEQATALAAPDQKWSSAHTAVSLSAGWREKGERPAVGARRSVAAAVLGAWVTPRRAARPARDGSFPRREQPAGGVAATAATAATWGSSSSQARRRVLGRGRAILTSSLDVAPSRSNALSAEAREASG
jgi:hypothetical protein